MKKEGRSWVLGAGNGERVRKEIKREKLENVRARKRGGEKLTERTYLTLALFVR
jgi:hypothetical protein